MLVSILIPVFNEEKTILEILNRLMKVNFGPVQKEIIVIDDGSTDKTPFLLKKLNKNPEIRFLNLTANMGKGEALKRGLQEARGKIIVTQDADLEYNPFDIPRLLEPLLMNKTSVVYGTRLKRLPHLRNEEKTLRFLIHFLGNRFLSFLTSLLYGQFLTDIETGYKAFYKKTLNPVTLKSRGFEIEVEITSRLLKSSYQIMEIPITTEPRGYKEGKKLRTLPDGLLAFWSIIKYRF